MLAWKEKVSRNLRQARRVLASKSFWCNGGFSVVQNRPQYFRTGI